MYFQCFKLHFWTLLRITIINKYLYDFLSINSIFMFFPIKKILFMFFPIKINIFYIITHHILPIFFFLYF